MLQFIVVVRFERSHDIESEETCHLTTTYSFCFGRYNSDSLSGVWNIQKRRVTFLLTVPDNNIQNILIPTKKNRSSGGEFEHIFGNRGRSR